MNTPLKLIGDGFTVSLTKEATRLAEELIENASSIKKVTNKDEEALATTQASALASYLKGIEAARKSVKQPVLDIGKQIDRVAEESGRKVLAVLEGIRNHLKSYQIEMDRQRRVIEEQERKARIEAARKLEEAETARRKAEADRLKAEQSSKPMMQVRADVAEEKAEAAEEAAITARVEAMTLGQSAEATKVRGGSMIWSAKVNDIHALYAANPRFVSLEVKKRELLEWAKAMEESGSPVELDGVTFTKVPKVVIR